MAATTYDRATLPSGCLAEGHGYIACIAARRRGGRVAEGARLESVYTGNRIVGSNPTPSAILVFAVVREQIEKPPHFPD
jgi:hypothetical protein